MAGKTIIVTGSSDGIGKFVALQLAKQGHTVIMHGRNEQKTKEAYEYVVKESGSQNVKYYLANFLSFESIKQFADQVKKDYDHIDVLINNAGAQFGDERLVTKEGHEYTMMINLLAPIYLTHLLLDWLQKSKSARVVTQTSASHSSGGQPPLDDIELEKSYSMPRSYGFSKLYIIWAMRHFIKYAAEKKIKNVTFNWVHPGSTDTGLGRESTKSWKWYLLYKVWSWFMMNSMEDAAHGCLYCAVDEKMEGVNGKYIGPKGEEATYDKYYTEENEKKVWDYVMNAIAPYIK